MKGENVKPGGIFTHSDSSSSRKILIKVVSTVVVGTATYLVTNFAQQSELAAVTLAAFVGGVALVVQFLLDFESRLAAVEAGQVQQSQDVRRLVEERFSKVSEATELFGRVETGSLHHEVVELVRESIDIGHPDPIVRDLARSQVERVTTFLRQISHGAAVYDGEDRDWLLSLVNVARSSIDATSSGKLDAEGRFVDEGLWSTELGLRYLEHQSAAIRRGVTIRRVFILATQELAADPAFRALYTQQKNMGINARVIRQEEVRLLGVLSDVVIFDDALMYESTPSSWNQEVTPMFVKTALLHGDGRVKPQVDRFHALWQSAEEL